eukprot:11189105-Lingulodinium_polyedra.AAC.1
MVVRVRVYGSSRHHCLLRSAQGAGMGVTCICNDTTDPMYIVTNTNTNSDYSTPTSGSKDGDPDSGSAKHVHISTRLVDSNIRVYRTQEHGRGMVPGVAKKHH